MYTEIYLDEANIYPKNNKLANLNMRLRIYSGWKQSISTSTHMLWHKKNWQCSINRDTGQVCFSRVLKIDTVELVEEGIE